MMSSFDLLAFGMPGWQELVIVAVIGLLIFGKRLPEVGRSLGKSIVEFKKGLKGVEDDIDAAVNQQDQADMLPPPDSTANTASRTSTSQSTTGESVSQTNSTHS